MNNADVKILIVEDEKDVRDSIEEILSLEGYKTEVAANVYEAMRLISKSKPELIISDILMPGASGKELLSEIKSRPNLLNIPFIFLTAQSEKENIRSGMNLGADDYLTKPFRSRDLISSVKIRLKKKHFVEEKIELIFEGLSKYVPHELRTPLVAILGYPTLIKDNFDDLDKEKIFEFLDDIEFGGKRLLNTLEKFIVYSNIKSREIKNETSGEAASSQLRILTDAILAQIELAQERMEDLQIDIEEAKVKINPSHLSMVLKQLIENALRFTKKGESIKIVGNKYDEKYRFEIIDKGIGMSKESISQIAPFVQFTRGVKEQSGNGLGLAITNSILNLYGYELSISSIEKEGTEVSFIVNIE